MLFATRELFEVLWAIDLCHFAIIMNSCHVFGKPSKCGKLGTVHKLHSHFNIAPIEMGIYVKIKWIFCDLSNQKGSIYPATDRRDLDFTRKKDYTDKPTGRGVFCLFQALTARYLNVTDCGGVGRGGMLKGLSHEMDIFGRAIQLNQYFSYVRWLCSKFCIAYCCGISLLTFHMPFWNYLITLKMTPVTQNVNCCPLLCKLFMTSILKKIIEI